MQGVIEMRAEMNARLDANYKEIMTKIDAETEAKRGKRMEAHINDG
jgi:hypothetical protein